MIIFLTNLFIRKAFVQKLTKAFNTVNFYSSERNLSYSTGTDEATSGIVRSIFANLLSNRSSLSITAFLSASPNKKSFSSDFLSSLSNQPVISYNPDLPVRIRITPIYMIHLKKICKARLIQKTSSFHEVIDIMKCVFQRFLMVDPVSVVNIFQMAGFFPLFIDCFC